MGINKQLLSEKKWAFCLIFLIVLFNPLFYFWSTDVRLKDKFFSWIICIVVGLALFIIDLFLKKKGEKIYLSILFLLSIAPNLIVWNYLWSSGLYMKRDMYWVIFNSHGSESKEYLSQFVPWQMIILGVIYILLGIFFIVKSRSSHSLSIKRYKALFTVSVLVVLLSMILQYLSQAIPTFDFYKSRILFWRENLIFEREKEIRRSIKMEVDCILPDSTDRVFVVFLGESTSSCHMSLYGYPRETTPLMDARRDELDVYTDVITPDNHTFGVMQKVLTFANHKHPEYFKERGSVVEMFNAAGFETYWISNKAFITKWGGSYGVIADEAKHVFDLSLAKKTDEIVVPYLRKVLNDDVRGNKVIFIHVMGNHAMYKSRYPENFDRFDHKKTNDLSDLDFRDEKMKQTIDEYDNSILYGDYVFDLILKEVKAADKSSYILFFSDHGDEVYDTRDARGHLMSNVYPCQAQIPFVLWRSEKYKEEMPDIIIDTSRPYSIENVIYSISTLSGLEYGYYSPEESIFSSEYKIPEIRWVGKEDYVDILKKTAE